MANLRPMTVLLRRLDEDGIEHLWVAYHDYSGVAPRKRCRRSRSDRRCATESFSPSRIST